MARKNRERAKEKEGQNMLAADRMKQFESGIFQLLNDKKMKWKGRKKVYNLSVGTPDFKPAPHIVEAVAEAAKKPENYKYALADIPELIKAVQERFAKDTMLLWKRMKS